MTGDGAQAPVGDGLGLTRGQFIEALTTASARVFADLGVRCASNRTEAAKLAQRAAEVLQFADLLARNEDEETPPANLRAWTNVVRLPSGRARNDNGPPPPGMSDEEIPF